MSALKQLHSLAKKYLVVAFLFIEVLLSFILKQTFSNRISPCGEEGTRLQNKLYNDVWINWLKHFQQKTGGFSVV